MLQTNSSLLKNAGVLSGTDLDASRESTKTRILIIDDDPDYIAMLKLLLRQADYDVSGVINQASALEACMQLKPDVILLDIMMPGQDGYSLFNLLRGLTNAPIIFVSAAPRSENLSNALEIGADDYISKPFDNNELVARIRKTLRQAHASQPPKTFVFPEVGLSVDLDARMVSLHGIPVQLLPREFSLLNILAEHAPRNVPYEKIARKLWGQDNPRRRAHLKTIAFSLRRKLEEDPAHPRILVNNRSIGYQLLTTG